MCRSIHRYPAERLSYMLADSAPVVLLTHEAIGPAAQARLNDALAQQASPPQVLDLRLVPIAGRCSRTIARVRTCRRSRATTWPTSSTLRDRPASPRASQTRSQAWRTGSHGSSTHCGPNRPSPHGRRQSGSSTSITEVLQTLLAGGTLVAIDASTAKDPLRLSAQLQLHAVTHLVLVPSLLAVLAALDDAPLASLRLLVCSGERLSPELVQTVLKRSPQLKLVNLYGSSEVNGDTTAFECVADPPPALVGRSIIGRPIANTRIYILDGHGEPVPVGVSGELHIGGVGLARGYLNRPELTAERFIASPFVAGRPSVPDGRSGPLACGRQHRVSGTQRSPGEDPGFPDRAGEIEARLAQHAGVREAVVVARRGRRRGQARWWRTTRSRRARRAALMRRAAGACAAGAAASTWCRRRMWRWMRCR